MGGPRFATSLHRNMNYKLEGFYNFHRNMNYEDTTRALIDEIRGVLDCLCLHYV